MDIHTFGGISSEKDPAISYCLKKTYLIPYTLSVLVSASSFQKGFELENLLSGITQTEKEKSNCW
ncbi:hypothetical protein BAU16_05485 [Enterococcus sp. JM9B]|nr:hypothetical protein BAU16_05485 [Enterococcus sp. JM9B]